jgi:hypothetical protein
LILNIFFTIGVATAPVPTRYQKTLLCIGNQSTRLMLAKSPLVFRVTVTSAFDRFRQNQSCVPNVASSTPESVLLFWPEAAAETKGRPSR